MRRHLSLAIAVSVVSGVVGLCAEEPKQTGFSPDELEFFDKSVRPVLIANCFKCHGSKKQEYGLRLDSRAAVLKGSDEGPVVQLGKPFDSPLVLAIHYKSDIEMPPAGKLKPAEIAALTRWVELGLPWPSTQGGGSSAGLGRGAWKTHWAFQPIGDPAIPKVKDRRWPRTSIDRFILAKLEVNQLQPSPQTDRRRLIRRASFDLIGMPPTPEEVVAFESDKSADAFEKVVNRLLDSPHYGERWGRYWLDIARYADNAEFHFHTRELPWAYAYRDYVIRAFNNDLPYNRFLLEQFAADQLELGDDKRPLTAMGFLTLGNRFLDVIHDIMDDRIDVVTRGVLGLTVTCARCHDHKFDPILQDDYYAMYGILRSSLEPVLPPTFLPPPNTEEYKKFAAEMDAREKKMNDFIDGVHAGYVTDARTRIVEYLLGIHAKRNQPDTILFMEMAKIEGDLNPTMMHRWERYLKVARKEGHPVWTAFHRFYDLADKEFKTQAAIVNRELLTANDPERPINPLVRQLFEQKPPETMKEVAQRYQTLLSQIEKKWLAALQQAAEKKQPAPTHLPDMNEDELRQVLYGSNAAPGSPQKYVNRFELTPKNKKEYGKLLEAVQDWSMNGPGAPPRAMVLVDAEELYNPYVFVRGNPGRRGKTASRRFLEVLNPSRKPFQNGSGRLEMAQAIIDPKNPLTARVIVNRVWHYHFGKGIVSTLGDFGSRGDPPSHPELLDHLARTFMNNGWSIGKLHRLIMSSAVYQQSSIGFAPRNERELERVSAVSPDPALIDPENRLLWKFNRRRLDFEATRDSLLAVSGSMDRTVGGKAVNILGDFEPRRTVYGFVDRMNLPGLLRDFDFPNPFSCSTSRDTTTTALQALYLMNNSLSAECARRLIERPEISAEDDPAQRVTKIFQLLFNRKPTAQERTFARDFLSPQPVPEDVKQLPETGNSKNWRYGYGTVDEVTKRVIQFTQLPNWRAGSLQTIYGAGVTHAGRQEWTSARWQIGPKYPDPLLGPIYLEADGGHPSANAQRLVIRRWISPITGTIDIRGTFSHKPKEGNGVRGRVFFGEKGLLGEWTTHHSKVETGLTRLAVKTGETLDFVVDCRDEIKHDKFGWTVVIYQTGATGTRIWNSKTDFRGKEPEPWQQYVQALLMTNEFVFVD